MIAPSQQERILLRVPEAAQALGIAPSYLWRLIQQGQIDVVKIGRSVRIRPQELEKFVEERQVPADDARR